MRMAYCACTLRREVTGGKILWRSYDQSIMAAAWVFSFICIERLTRKAQSGTRKNQSLINSES